MSASSPADLALTFRSLTRRLREARGDLGAGIVAPQVAAIDRHLARAAHVMRSTPDPASIADAIEAMPAAGWDDELAELRTIALELGRELRAVAAANPDLAD
ncbi:MAG: hypothetical protein NTZ21_14585 [Actinobacteria bacterium]|nr:hypothetical protein [Actinomycetota bacterium]